jgi:hypothetical protein
MVKGERRMLMMESKRGKVKKEDRCKGKGKKAKEGGETVFKEGEREKRKEDIGKETGKWERGNEKK